MKKVSKKIGKGIVRRRSGGRRSKNRDKSSKVRKIKRWLLFRSKKSSRKKRV